MSYLIKAFLRNAQQPEKGSAEIMFPLSRQQYDIAVGLLKDLNAGDAIAQDCMVEDIDSDYNILGCLKGQRVNLDELDYLAKRLDSFDVYEAQQFQAACHAFGCEDIRSLINMTFCSQNVTVISDFSKLEEAGKQHYLTIHGGSAPVDEINAQNGRTLSERLLQSGEGKLTPYGVLFRNGMRMEEPYNGHAFPGFLWDRPVAEVELTQREGESVTVFLPTTRLAFSRFCERSGISLEGLEPDSLSWGLRKGDELDLIGSLADLWDWNEICERLDDLSDAERQRCFAAFEVMAPDSPEQAELLINNIHDFTLCPGVKDAEGLGRYMIQKSGRYEYDPALELYYNYEALGEFLMLHQIGQITRLGYLQCAEESGFAEFFTLNTPEQGQAQEQLNPCLGLGYRPAPMSQDMKIGGMTL